MASPLTQGNAALRAGQYAQAVRHFALGLLKADSQRLPWLSATLASSLLLARKRYRQERRAAGRLQVGISSWSLSENPAGRAHTLAVLYQDLAKQQEGEVVIDSVELIGSLFARRGRELWAPIRNTRIPVHSILVEDDARFMEQAIDLVSAHPYDLVHLAKPRFPNILFGLLYQLLWDARILLDLDDDELAFVRADQALPLARWLRTYQGFPPWDNLPGRPWTELALSLTQAFDGVSVANRALRQCYGGTIIRHARDPQQFQPSAQRRTQARAHWNINPEQPVVLFLGTPRRHKGVLETAEALARLNKSAGTQSQPLYLIAGRFPQSEKPTKDALEALHASGQLAVRLLDDQPFDKIPDLLAAADLAVFLQDPDARAARLQTPAKLSDALAMGLTVLAEPTPGLADLAEQGAFIPVNRDSLPGQLARALQAVRHNNESQSPPDPGPHPVFTRELSLQANRARLQALIHPAGSGPNAHIQSHPPSVEGRERGTRHDQGIASSQASAPPLNTLPPGGATERLPSDRGSQDKTETQEHLQRFASHPALGPLPRALINAEPRHRQGVSIIILSLDGAELLQRLLQSFSAHNSHQPIELIIIDHSQAPEAQAETLGVLQRFQPQLPIWPLPRGQNYSFSDSCNLAAGLARYPNLLFLNNDIHYCVDAIPPALRRLADPHIGLVGIRIDDDPERLPPGHRPSVQHLGIEFLWSKKRGYHHPRQIRHPSVSEVPLAPEPEDGKAQPAVTGAFLLCRKTDFDQLGGFSRAYDYGLEDIDLCLRMRRDLNKVSWCITGLALQHAESTTRRRDRTLTGERIKRNHEQFKAQWADQARHLTSHARS